MGHTTLLYICLHDIELIPLIHYGCLFWTHLRKSE